MNKNSDTDYTYFFRSFCLMGFLIFSFSGSAYSPTDGNNDPPSQHTSLLSTILEGSDCNQATTICTSSDIVYNPVGIGTNDFNNAANQVGCIVGGEHLTAWYYFEFNENTPPGTSIEFTLSPNNGTDDYDFAIWGPNVDCDGLGNPVRCSSAAVGVCGLMEGAGETTEGPGVGDGFVDNLIVNPGDGFLMMVDNFSTSYSGFTLTWSASADDYLDCTADPPDCDVRPSAGNDQDICSGETVQLVGITQGGSSPLVLSWTADPASAQDYIQSPNNGVTNVVFPADAPIGDYTFIFTGAQGDCSESDEVIVTITADDPPVLDNFDDTCENGAIIALPTTQDGIEGTWSGTGVDNNGFNPSGLNGAITLTFTPNPGQCIAGNSTEIMVVPTNAPMLDAIDDLCALETAVDLPITQSGLEGQWSGTGVDNNAFDPMGLSGEVILTFTPNSPCAMEADISVTVEEAIEPFLDNFENICSTAPPLDLPFTQDGIDGIWVGNGVNGNIFEPDGLNGSIDLSFIPDDGQCAMEAMTVIEVIEGIEPQLDNFEPICQTEAAIALPTVQDGINGTWSGSGVMDNEFNPDGQMGIIDLTFTPNSEEECALEAMTTIEVTDGRTPLLESFSPVCPEDVPVNLNGIQDGVSGTWTGTNVTGNQFDPDGLSGTIVLTFTPDPGQCALEAMTNIEVTGEIEPDLDVFDPLCESDDLIFLPTSQNGISGSWDGDGVAANSFNPNGLSGIIDLIFIPDVGQCAVEAMTTIEVTAGVIPLLDNFQDVCATDNPVPLSPTQDGIMGEWSGNGVNNNEFDPSGQMGDIDLMFTPDAGQCAEENTTTITVDNPAPINLSSTNLTTCDVAAQGSVLNFTELLMGNNLGGTWADTDASGADVSNPDMVDFDGLTPNTYTFTYTAPSSNTCPPESVEIEVLVQNCMCPSVATIAPNDLCNESGMLDLTTLEDGADAGSWSITSSPAGANPASLTGSIFDATGADAGDYEITFTLDMITNGCPETATQMLTVTPTVAPALDDFGTICDADAAINLPTTQSTITGTWSGTNVNNNEFDPSGQMGDIDLMFTPDAGQCAEENTTTITVDNPVPINLSSTSLTTCDVSAQGSVLNFTELLMGNNLGGTWTDTDASGADVSDPDMVDFDGLTPNTYTFTYTALSSNTCPPESVEIEVLVQNCMCPSVATIAPNDLCNADGMLDLTTLEDGADAGSWSITSSPAGANPASLTGSIFDATGADAGDYEITFTLDMITNGCPESSSQTLTVEAQPFAVLSSNTANICNDPDNNSLLDLASLIIDGQINGTWLDTDGTGVNFANTSAVDFTNVPVGTYTFTYATNIANVACPDQSYELEVLVENCMCPSVALGSQAPLCNSEALIDLADLEVTNEAGTWTILNTTITGNIATLNGTIFDANGTDAGTYELEFTLDNPISNCPSSNTLMIEIEAALSAGTAATPLAFCPEQNETVTLSELITEEDMGGSWQETSATPSTGSAFDAVNGIFNTNNQASGTYTFTYNVGNVDGVCSSDQSTVTIVIDEAPTAEAGLNQQLTCETTMVTLDGSASTGDSYEWTDAAGNSVGTTPNIQVETSGTYTLTVLSAAGCTATDQVQVASEAPAIQADIMVNQPDCTEPTGDISLTNVSGGTPTFSYSINGGTFSFSSQFSDLEAGAYDIVIQDMEGCLWDTSIVLNEAIVPILDLGPDLNLFIGDTETITVATNIQNTPFPNIEWSNDSIVSCDSLCLSAILSPTETTTLFATITDDNGCTATDELLLFVDRTPAIYAPTGFTPDGDNINDYFMIYTGKGVETFKSLQIFSRWGEVVFEKIGGNLALNQDEEGWDGLFKGEKVNPDVYIWVAVFELKDGREERRSGEVVIIR